MRPILAVAAVITALILVLACATTAVADRASSTGFTSVATAISDNTLIWTVKNTSGPTDGTPGWDVLIWTFMPEGIPAPSAWTAPEGWSWGNTAGGSFTVDSNLKYQAGGPAIEPGEQAVFTCTFSADTFRQLLPSADQIPLLTHIGAVSEIETGKDGTKRWQEAVTPYGKTWWDKPVATKGSTAVPEPSAMVAVFAGLMGLTGVWRRSRS